MDKRIWEILDNVSTHGVVWTPFAWAIARGIIKAIPHVPKWTMEMVQAIREVRKLRQEMKRKK